MKLMSGRIKNLVGVAVAILLGGFFIACGSTQQFQIEDKMLVAGSYWDTIAVVNRSSGDVIEWKYGLPEGSECNSVEIIPETGDVLFSYRKGARVVKRDSVNGGGTIVWDYTDIADGAELQTAVRLPDGGYLLAICDTPARFVELDSTGLNVRKEVRYDLGISQAHSQFRRVVKAANGNYLVPLVTKGKLLEIKDHSTLVKEYNVGGSPFSVQELSTGNLLVSLGNSHSVVEIDRVSGSVVHTIEQNDILSVPLQFVTHLQRLENGNTLIANWQGYLPAEKQTIAQLVEIDSTNAVVWSYDGRKGLPVKSGGVDFISAFYPFSE